MTMQTVTRELAEKVLKVVDAGLCSGVGVPRPGKMCVEAAVCYAMGLPHGDEPSCVSPALRALKIRLNDSNWSSEGARAKGLRRLAVAQLGSAGALDEKEFTRRVAWLAVKKWLPAALRAAASMHPEEKHKVSLNKAADDCENADAARAARDYTLAACCEDVVGVLIELKAPGCQWLSLTGHAAVGTGAECARDNDRVGLANVLYALSIIAQHKADHVEENWQDRTTARAWQIEARRLDRTARQVKIGAQYAVVGGCGGLTDE